VSNGKVFSLSRGDVAGPPDEKPYPEHQPNFFIWVVVQSADFMNQFIKTEGSPCNREKSQYYPPRKMAFHAISSRVRLELYATGPLAVAKPRLHSSWRCAGHLSVMA
jgi:hypothetical protein